MTKMRSSIDLNLLEVYIEAFEIVQHGAIWLNKDGQVLGANSQFAKDLGYTHADLLSKTIFQINPYTNLIQWRRHWQELLEKKQIILDTGHITADGTIFPVKMRGIMVDAGREVVCCAIVENQVHRDGFKDLIELASNVAGIGSWQLNLIQKKWFFSRNLREMLGLREDYCINADNIKALLTNYLDISTAKKLVKLVEKSIKSGEKFEMELPVHLDRGQAPVSFKVIGQMVCIEQRTVKMYGILQEISRGSKSDKIESKTLAGKRLKANQDGSESENALIPTAEIGLTFNFDHIVSKDPNYKKVLKKVEQVAATEATVLILGETGTGKELLAKAIHQQSNRAKKEMVIVNCAALPKDLIESELFGHEKGAFTGAHKRKIGRFELADQGTLFLDEIGELSQDVQVKLLRVLQEHEFERVGGTETIKTNVRVIAATNKNLEQLVKEGKFRHDLYYRLNVFPIYNIPLRERRQDIPLLVRFFTEKFAKKCNKKIKNISQNLLNILNAYPFPGNVRELENLIERAVIMAKDETLQIDDKAFQTLEF